MMAQRGEQLADQIHRDLACPQCQYNLRGLRGEVVHCPECGLECDVAQMIARQWTGPWYNAPGFTQLLMPVAWLTCTSFFVLYIGVVELQSTDHLVITTLVIFGMLSNWIRLLAKAHRQYREGAAALALALLAHAIFAGYVLAVVGIAWSIINQLVRPNAWLLPANMFILMIMVGIFVFCRRGERHIAEQCIRWHLLRTSDAESSAVA